MDHELVGEEDEQRSVCLVETASSGVGVVKGVVHGVESAHPALLSRHADACHSAGVLQDPVTLDHLRTFISAVEEGNFSAAARKLGRVQSAVSAAMATLEDLLGVQLWDRTRRVATLTDEGQAVLVAARRVLAEIDSLRNLTAALAGGSEAKVALCVDAIFPVTALVEACAAFAKAHPAVDLQVDTETMSAVGARVLEKRASLGIATPMAAHHDLERIVLADVRMVPVVSPQHPLAPRGKRRTPTARLAEHVQIVLSERSANETPDQAVLSPRTWRVADLATKHAMLRGGLGWGNLPEHVVHDDLASGALVRLRPEAWRDDEHVLAISAIHRRDVTLGPAHRWLVDELGRLCRHHLSK